MTPIADLFPASYTSSRLRFRGYLERLQARWPLARLVTRPLPGDPNLTQDWIEAVPRGKREKVLLFTLGEHGIEGFVGSAILDLFVNEFLPRIDPETTGLVLVHAVNPWGMAHRRRVNAANVDLNRNFVWNERDLDPTANPDYARISTFFNPRRPIKKQPARLFWFAEGLASRIRRMGAGRLKSAMLLGQYRFGRGVYYGGETRQPETLPVIDLFRSALESYPRILLLDMHTGYGPRHVMSVVNSVFERRTSKELKLDFAYPDVVKSDPTEFYAIQGDMIDYVYTLAKNIAPSKHLYAASFEFGTFGDSFAAALRSLRTVIEENCLHWYGAAEEAAKERILTEYTEMFYPSDPAWQARAVENARRALRNILQAEGFGQV